MGRELRPGEGTVKGGFPHLGKAPHHRGNCTGWRGSFGAYEGYSSKGLMEGKMGNNLRRGWAPPFCVPKPEALLSVRVGVGC